jgi:hypothetical protein
MRVWLFNGPRNRAWWSDISRVQISPVQCQYGALLGVVACLPDIKRGPR